MHCQNHPDVIDGLVECWRCGREFCLANCVIELQETPFCADCKTAQVRDILAGTDMRSLDFATLKRRRFAWIIDGLLKFGILIGASQLGNVIIQFATGPVRRGQLGTEFALMTFFIAGQVAGMCYEAVMMAYNKGQTLGKMAMNIRVVTAEGNPVSTKQAWWRATLKMMFFCFGCEVGVGVLIDAIFALGQERASLHDLGAKTRVVNAWS